VSGARRARRTIPMRTAKSCGPDASEVGVKFCGGAKAQPGPSARYREATEAESPTLRGEREISRKAIAQGMSDCLRCPVCSCAVSLPNLHTRPRVQCASGIPCSLVRGTTIGKPRAKPCRENADVHLLFDIRIAVILRCEPLRRASKDGCGRSFEARKSAHLRMTVEYVATWKKRSGRCRPDPLSLKYPATTSRRESRRRCP
jgi:hypothetical protein